ncbi:MAG: hypothetical protein FWF94_00330 [Oscillospiraceae bacterium]|nr:hypothetical protein [Oscillospiraceae bacterium]
MNTTVTTTNNKVNKAFSYLRFRITEMKVLIVINCIVAAAGFPLFAAIFAKYTHMDFGSPQSQYFNFTLLFFLIPLVGAATMFMTYACGVTAFSHLHNKSISDMHLSLPLTHRQRFWANFAAGLSSSLVPFIVSFFIGILIFQIFGNKSFGSNITEGYEMTGIQRLVGEYMTNIIDGIINDYVIPIVFIGITGIVMTYSLTVFCNTLCGKFFTAAFFPFLISGLVPLLTLTTSTLAVSQTRGVSDIGSFPYAISTPIGYVLSSASLLTGNKIKTVYMPVYIIPVLLIIAIMIISSYFLSKNVKAENIGRDFLYKSIYNVQQGLVCLSVVSFFGLFYSNVGERYTNWLIILAAIFSFVIFAVGHIVHYKGFKKLKSGAIKYAVMLCSSLAVCVILIMGKGFGGAEYIPPANSISAVKILEFGNTDVTVNSDMLPLTNDDYAKFARTDKYKGLSIEIRRVHKMFLDNPDTLNSNPDVFRFFGSSYYFVDIDYQLKNGLIIKRRYLYENEDVDMLIDAGVLVEAEPFWDIAEPTWDISGDVPEPVLDTEE